MTRRYLSYLAHHPDTARRIARSWRSGSSPTPPRRRWWTTSRVYLDNDTAIKPVLRALIATAEFQGSAGQKVRTSTEDIIATYRALGVKVAKPTQATAAANAMLYQTTDLGLAPFAWARPDGQPDHNEAWSSASRLLASFRIHYVMSGGWYPTQDARYRKPVSWLPARRSGSTSSSTTSRGPCWARTPRPPCSRRAVRPLGSAPARRSPPPTPCAVQDAEAALHDPRHPRLHDPLTHRPPEFRRPPHD